MKCGPRSGRYLRVNTVMAQDPVQEQLEAYNTGDVERFMACYTPDCVIEDGAGNRLLTGHGEMLLRYTTLFKNSPQLQCEIINRIRIGSYVIDEERITGRVPAMNHAVVIYRVKDGLIEHVRFIRETD